VGDVARVGSAESEESLPETAPAFQLAAGGIEVGDVDDAIVVEIALQPSGVTLLPMRGEDIEIGDIDGAVEIRVAIEFCGGSES
jgi:hypothetical protein